MIKSDEEMEPGTVHRFLGIYFKAMEILGKPQLGDSLLKAVLPVIASNGVPYLQMTSVGTHITTGK